MSPEIFSRMISQVEEAASVRVSVPKDYDLLSEKIFARTGQYLSPTTLKRLWGYINDGVKPSATTLTILARFLGYRDCQHFLESNDMEKESDPVMSRRVDVNTELRPGDSLVLTWLPDRVCRVEYAGNLKFTVVESTNTRLQPDDTFCCGLFIEGEPLYIDNLFQADSRMPVAYVCGKKNGIRFEVIRKSKI